MLSPSAQGKTLQFEAAFLLKQLILPSPAVKFSFFISLWFCNSIAEFFQMPWHVFFFNQLCYQNKPAY